MHSTRITLTKSISITIVFAFILSLIPWLSINANASTNKQIVFLYAGINTSPSHKYLTYSSSDISGFTNNEFVISGGNGFTRNMDYSTNIRDFGDLARTIVSVKPNAQIWLSTPYENGTYSNTAAIRTWYHNYFNALRTEVGTTIWNNNIAGIYFFNERVQSDYTYTLATLPSHPQITLWNDLAYYIRNTLSKQTMWAPYYGYNSTYQDIVQAIGYIANRTAIFDYILLQPHYYFEEIDATGTNLSVNLDAIYESIQANAVKYRDGTIVGGSRAQYATAEIGVQMEVTQAAIYSGSDYQNRYLEYVNTFSSMYNQEVISFYMDQKIDNQSLWNSVRTRVNNFFNSGTY